jgi:hypothetical protein
MPTAEEFKLELVKAIGEAFEEGKDSVEISAGELHRRVGGYPGANHRMPVCCQVMRSEFKQDCDIILEEPPSGQGASFTIRYKLPRLVKTGENRR